jgi:hypothetical protein
VSDLIWVAIIAATPPTIASVLTAIRAEKKIDAVHALANNRLTEAIEGQRLLHVEIETLQHRLGQHESH